MTEENTSTTTKDLLEQFSVMYVNGCPFKKVDGQWVPDDELRHRLLEQGAADQKRKDALIFACRSRICTPEEMAEIEREGINLFVHMHGGMSDCYREGELEKRLDDLLLQQFRLRRIAETVKAGELGQ